MRDELIKDKRYLSLLAREFPSVQSACTEIINLSAILSLPKGTEHFMSDIHGESEAFLHIMNNASGIIREKIEEMYSTTLSASERKALSSLIYYPEQYLDEVAANEPELDDWYKITLHRLIDICASVSLKYTRSKVRKALPKDFEYVIDEMLHTNHSEQDKMQYYERIIASIIDIDRAGEFILALCNLIKRMAVDRLHIVGDIFDRGAHADVILDKLMTHHSVDIQWGNHDVLWMGAAAGSLECILTVLNISMSYNNLDMIETAYGLNLLPLAMFATDTYEPSPVFAPKGGKKYNQRDNELVAKMRKAVCIMLFKLQGQLVRRRPEFQMDERDVLSRIDFKSMTYDINGVKHPLLDTQFPTIDPKKPCELTKEERYVLSCLRYSFENSERLHRHIKFLYTSGSLYRIYNGNLLFHGCMPTDSDGSFTEFTFNGEALSGKALFDYCDAMARQGYYAPYGSDEREYGRDFLWFLWCGRNSPIFGRERITTFERLFIEDESTWKEPKNCYYTHWESESYCTRLLAEFGLTGDFCHIINGHVPVRVKDGEDPTKGNGRLIVIDGGFCRAYQKVTGIAGYTMFFSSHGIRVVAHEPFDGRESGHDINSTTVIFKNLPKRMYIGDTDTGREINERINELKTLLRAYRLGIVSEQK